MRGTLYKKRHENRNTSPWWSSGKKRRAGTENVPAIVGLGKAIELVTGEIEESNKTLLEMRERLIKGLLKIPKTHLNGHPTKRLANNVNVTFEYIEGESLLLLIKR